MTKYQEDGPIPKWSEAKAFGNYKHIRCALPTRDGRKTGNAVNAGVYRNSEGVRGHW